MCIWKCYCERALKVSFVNFNFIQLVTKLVFLPISKPYEILGSIKIFKFDKLFFIAFYKKITLNL